jgi:hypothetical protein
MTMQSASPPPSPWFQLGCTIYYFGEHEQDRLLVECIAPLARALRERALCRRFWFCRFDARGPHIMVVLTVAAESRAELEARVSAAVQGYLDASPSRIEIDQTVLDERHRACRGRTQSAVDSYAGLASNNSFLVHEHGPEHHPFVLGRGWSRSEHLWRFVDELSLWAIECLSTARGAATGPAVRWLASFERALAAAGHAPRAYWRYHAGTMALGIADRIASKELGAEDVLARIGDTNRGNLARLWQHDQEDHGGPDPAQLVELVLGDDELAMERRRQIVREVIHVLFLQLGVRASVEMVIILFAWLRAAEGDEDTPVRAGS